MKNLKKLRKEYDLSQQQLADILSVTQQTVYKYENSLAEPNMKTLIQLADFFHTTTDYLIDRTDDDTVINVPSLSRNEKKHLEMYRKLDPITQKHIDGIMAAIEKESTFHKK